jgi:hypothetical protein
MIIMRKTNQISVALLALVTLVSGCNRPEKKEEPPNPRISYLQKIWAVQIPVVQCLVNKKLIPPQQYLRDQAWLKNGKVMSGADFNVWFSSHQLNRFGKKTLEDSVRDAAEIGPNHDCDTLLNAPPAD